MAGIHYRPTTPGGDLEDLRFGTTASAGALTEPSSTHRATGWALGEKPSYKEFNYTAQKLWRWMARLRGVGLFLEAHTFEVDITATGAVGYVRTITISGVPVSYTTQAGDTTAIIATRWAYALNADAVVSAEYDIYLTGATTICFVCRTPAKTPVVALADVNAVRTVIIAAPYKVRLSDDDAAFRTDIDFVFGSTSTEDTGAAADDARMLFDKSKAAARLGRASGTQWDDASRGDASMAWGEDCTASGAHSTAGGSSCTAVGARSIAIGSSNTASAADAIAVGSGNTASAANACAIGAGCTANAVAATAIGQGATAGKQNAVAIGMGNAQGVGAVAIGGWGFGMPTASAQDAIAMGSDATASAQDAVAIGTTAMATGASAVALGEQASAAAAALAVGTGATASGASAVALGNSALASGQDSVAVGKSAIASGESAIAAGEDVVASGIGALATGKSNGVVLGLVSAVGDGSRAHGQPNSAGLTYNTTATGRESDAFGTGCQADADRSQATGLASRATNPGEKVHAATQFSGGFGTLDTGATQIGTVHVKAETTDATPTDLTAGGTYAWTPLDDGAYMVKVMAVAKQVGFAAMEAWDFHFAALKSGGAVTFPAGVTPVQYVYNGGAGQVGTSPANIPSQVTGALPPVDLRLDQNAGSVRMLAVGNVGETWRWSGRMEYVRVGD